MSFQKLRIEFLHTKDNLLNATSRSKKRIILLIIAQRVMEIQPSQCTSTYNIHYL